MSRRASRARALGAGLASILLASFLLATALSPAPALAHAALVEAHMLAAIRIVAVYDTGEPMAQAQVIVYAPDAPASAWSRGVTDDEGRFDFVPDPALPGRWSVQVRQAGHGAIAHVDIPSATEGARVETAVLIATDGSAGLTLLQRLTMVALVAWGALGTGLFFMRRRGGGDAPA